MAVKDITMKGFLSIITKIFFSFLIVMVIAIDLMIIEEKLFGKYIDFWNGWICGIMFYNILFHTTKSNNN